MEEELKSTLKKAIENYTDNLGTIKRLAFRNGGRIAVDKVAQQLEELRNIYFEILKKELDKNNVSYVQLIEEANSEGAKLSISVNQLNNINDIVNITTSVVNLSGQILQKLVI